jgi:hypothetical protein
MTPMKPEPCPHAEPDSPLTVWSLWHFQSMSDDWTQDNDELPHLLIGYFSSRAQAEELQARIRNQPGLCEWPLGFRIGHEHPDQSGAWERGFAGWWDDAASDVDVLDTLRLPEPPRRTSVLWDVWHFRLHDAAAPPDPLSAKGIGLFTSCANAETAIAHHLRQPGFRDWPQGFRIFRRRLGVAFGLEGFRERYGWEAWRDSLRG